MEEIERKIEAQNSCKISINAKGLWSGEVKAYAKTLEEAYKIAVERALELEERIKNKNK